MNTMNLYFWFRQSKTKPGTGSVVCVVNIDGDESVPYSTRIIVPKQNWNAADQCFEGKNSAKYEKILKLFCKRLEEIKDEIEASSPKALVGANEVIARHREEQRKEVDIRQKKIIFFRDCLREFMKNRAILLEHGRITESTYNIASGRVKTIMDYLKNNDCLRLRPNQITESFMQQLKEDFISNGYEDSTIARYESFLKSVLKLARKKELILYSTLQDYKIEPVPEKEPIYPTKREFYRMLIASEGNPTFEKVMEIYCFCSYTSLSIGDYLDLSEDDFEADDDGTLWICRERGKTDTWQRIPLNTEALAIIEKYKTTKKDCLKLPILDAGRPVFLDLPKMTNQSLNKYLKNITFEAKVKKDLTFHSSRRFQVSHLINELKVDSLIAREVIGWRSDRQFKIYTKIDKSTIKSHVLKS